MDRNVAQDRTEFHDILLHVLNATSDEYENVSSILSQVSKDVVTPVAPNDIAKSLEQLVRKGLVDMFQYDPVKRLFCRVDSPSESKDSWYLINEAGRKFLDVNWPGDASL